MPTTNSGSLPSTALGAWLRNSAHHLEEHHVPSPRSDAETLLAHVLNIGRGELLRRVALGEHLPRQHEDTYEELVAERARRIPLQHLTGAANFAGLQLRIGPGVFVPRFETELMVEKVAQFLGVPPVNAPVIVDLCTGSGAIALAVKQRVPNAEVY
ncbi:MAG: peptide chain release factor N(5)-glutamine methyltransferase, partial [Ornithinimicrobium sp.]